MPSASKLTGAKTAAEKKKDRQFFRLAKKAAADGDDDGDITMLEQMVATSSRELFKRPDLEEHGEEAAKIYSTLEQFVYYEDHHTDPGKFGRSASSNTLSQLSQHESMDDMSTDDGLGDSTAAGGQNHVTSTDELLGPEAEAFIRQILEREFPSYVSPSLADLINVGRFHKGSHYKPGEWVELQGPDMGWRCEMVTRVLKIAPDDWDWNDPDNEGLQPDWDYYYHAGEQRMIQVGEVRSPKEGLVRLFGQRPWVWQQFACLKLEYMLRFQVGHQNDFESKDVIKYTLELWEEWLNHPSNADFKAVFDDDRIGDRGRRELINHIMTPFDLIRRIQDDRDEWNFEEEKSLSVFTYVGVLGSGYLIPIAIVVMQVVAPCLLIWNLFQSQDIARDNNECADFRLFPWHYKCPQDRVAQFMAVVVLFYYILRVIPSVFHSFYENGGGGDSLYSRLISMRREIWIRGDDRWEQKIGFRLDEYMNTAYVNFLFMLNMFIMINTQSAFDILLNALAFEFIVKFDEEFVDSPWWDIDRRWIMAGSMEMVLQEVLRRHVLGDVDAFSETFGIPADKLEEIADGDKTLFMNRKIATRDMNDPSFMTNDEVVKHMCLRVALETKNKIAINEYRQPVVYFGFVMKHFKRAITGINGGGVFDRNGDLRTWSRWEKVLYLAAVPKLDDTLYLHPSSRRVCIHKHVAKLFSTAEQPFENLESNLTATEWAAFLAYYFKVISLRLMGQFLYVAWKDRRPGLFIYRLIDGVCQWVAFVLQLFFPLYAVICMIGMLLTILKVL